MKVKKFKHKKIILFVCIILLVIIPIFYNYFNNIQENMSNKYTIICSRYNKNTDFLDKLSDTFDVKIIQKKNIKYDNKYVDHEVVNIANEATSYLSYIIKYYDHLPDNMIFIHDENKSWHHDGLITDNINIWIKEYEKSDGFYEFNNSKADGCQWCYTNDIFKELWKKLVPNKKLEDHTFNGKCCAQFIISKKTILLNSKQFYIYFYNWLIDNTNGEGNGSSEDKYSGRYTSRFSEWLWRAIFKK